MRCRFDIRRKGRQIQDLLEPAQALGRTPTNDPEEHQPPRNLDRFGCPMVSYEPREGAPVRLEILTDAIEPPDLCRPDESVCGQRSFRGAVTYQSLDGILVFTCIGELADRECTHGLEHLVQRPTRRRRIASEKETLVDQAGCRPECFVVARRTVITAGQHCSSSGGRESCRQRAETAKQTLLARGQ